MNAALLIEIGVEELPPKAMEPLAAAFAGALAVQLDAADLDHGKADYFATPRRLAVLIADVAAVSRGQMVEKQGPTLEIAYDGEGHPSKAGEGFDRSVGTTFDALEIEDSAKGRRLIFRGAVPGQPLTALLQPAVDTALHRLPIAKRMRWGDSEAAFVRPVHWLVAMHDSEVLPLTVFGQEADRYTRGHRFHHPKAIELARADAYVKRLKDPGYVIADIAERRRRVHADVVAAAGSLGGHALIDDALVDEVVALVEWPVGLAGHFAARYLELPREVIVATLQGHQRYFPVENATGELIAGFVTVANIDSRDPAQVIAGNERVIAPRLADALFFWEQDRRHGLAAHIPGLARVSFQAELGTLADKSQRIARIAAEIAPAVAADASHVKRAAALAKTDLLTDMVDEFPELQGVIGGYYAAAEGEAGAVAQALSEQYDPVSAGAAIAVTPVGRCIAVADRLDTLAGLFAIDKRPSGDRDPFGLRRAALGVLRNLIEGEIQVDLAALLNAALTAQPVASSPETVEALWLFHVERLRHYYSERGVPAARFESIAALWITDMLDFDRRLRAVGKFMQLPEAPVVSAAHKRIRNILKRNADAVTAERTDSAAMTEAAEKNLYESLQKQTGILEGAVQDGDYTAALSALAPLADPLDRFFEEVMVMTDDPVQQRNRLALLFESDRLCRRVADLSCLSAEATG
jgi:glycyl-tRNA synthetase beta chain